MSDLLQQCKFKTTTKPFITVNIFNLIFVFTASNKLHQYVALENILNNRREQYNTSGKATYVYLVWPS